MSGIQDLDVFLCVLIALSIFQQAAMADKKLSCAYSYLAEDHYPNCQRNNLTDSSECGVEECENDDFLCYSIYKYVDGVLEPHILGCNYRDPLRLAEKQCGKDKCILYKSHVKSIYECCCYGNFCNRNVDTSAVTDEQATTITTLADTTSNTPTHLPFTFQSTLTTTAQYTDQNIDTWLYCLIPLFLTIVLITVIMIYYRKCKQIQIRRQNNTLLMRQVEASSVPPLLRARFEVLQLLHRGHFSYVEKCKYKDNIVAVKYIKCKTLWEAEKQVYEHCVLQNKNILNFVEALDSKSHQEFYIITEYHQYGSLVDFLKKYTLTLDKLLTFLENITGGLSFLHNSCAKNEKPSIAHRDLKSSNIFVTDNWTCCIGDFGLALSLADGVETTQSFPDIQQVGTKRYMAPEVLEGSIVFCWESFLQADVYSLALVMWELVSRCNTDTVTCGEYQYVFHDVIGANPHLQDIEKCVCEDKKRPAINEKWKTNTILNRICETMVESWDEDPFARVTASCTHKRMLTLQQQYEEEELNASMAEDTTVLLSGSVRDERASSSGSNMSEEHVVLIHPRL